MDAAGRVRLVLDIRDPAGVATSGGGPPGPSGPEGGWLDPGAAGPGALGPLGDVRRGRGRLVVRLDHGGEAWRLDLGRTAGGYAGRLAAGRVRVRVRMIRAPDPISGS